MTRAASTLIAGLMTTVPGWLGGPAVADPIQAEDPSPGESTPIPDPTGPEVDTPSMGTDAPDPAVDDGGLDHLVPELAGNPYQIDSGRRPYARRLTFSPGYGQLGNNELYALRLGYYPSDWLGYEVQLEHNPGSSTHALMHTLSAHIRYPLPWRLQPYATVGFGMFMVYPGPSVNADPVTKNVATYGGGLEVYIRNDVALRGELRQASVFGGDPEQGEATVYRYGEATVGVTFYRTLGD